MTDQLGDITIRLQQWRAGSKEAENELFDLVMRRLLDLARYFMRGERKGHTLQSHDLVNEVYCRMVAAKHLEMRDRKHFFALVARAMRRYLIDYSRRRHGANFVPIQEIEELLPESGRDLDLAIDLDRHLEELAGVNPDWCTLVEMKVFLRLSDDETAEEMDLPLRTMQRMWRDARRWLFVRLGSGSAQQNAAP